MNISIYIYIYIHVSRYIQIIQALSLLMSHDQFMSIRDAENVHLGDALWLFGHMQQPKVGWYKDLPTIASEQDTCAGHGIHGVMQVWGQGWSRWWASND